MVVRGVLENESFDVDMTEATVDQAEDSGARRDFDQPIPRRTPGRIRWKVHEYFITGCVHHPGAARAVDLFRRLRRRRGTRSTNS